LFVYLNTTSITDGQQFYLYQQREQLSIFSHNKSLNTKKSTIYGDGIPGPSLGEGKCGAVKLVS